MANVMFRTGLWKLLVQEPLIENFSVLKRSMDMITSNDQYTL